VKNVVSNSTFDCGVFPLTFDVFSAGAKSRVWLAALDDFRNWLRVGRPRPPCALWRDIAP